jgi:hypothetical protein
LDPVRTEERRAGVGCKKKAPPKQEGKVKSAKAKECGSSLAAPAEASLYKFASKVRITVTCRYTRMSVCKAHAHSLGCYWKQIPPVFSATNYRAL